MSDKPQFRTDEILNESRLGCACARALGVEPFRLEGGDDLAAEVEWADGLELELARMADVSRAAMSRTVAHLAEDGFVEVGSSDDDASNYRAPVRLTDKGVEAARPLDDIIRRVLDEAGGELAMRERLQMYDSLNHILERLRTFGREK